jgi:MFS family permease
MYFPLIPLLSTTFATPLQSINLTITAYAIAQALSPALFASLSDHFGRRTVLLPLIALYALASAGLVFVARYHSRDSPHSYVGLITLRVLQSIGGSPTPAIAYGVVADVVGVAERGGVLRPMLATCNALSAVGPVVGGAVAMATEGVE